MNFRRIVSKSSLRSSTSSRKNNYRVDEIKKLQDEIESLKLNTSSLKDLLENRDVAIGRLASEKEKLYIELKSLRRINRNQQQELVDEREIHSKEKDYLLDNIKRLSLKLASSRNPNSSVLLDDKEHILELQNEIKSKDEVIYNICSKYLKLKKVKKEIQMKFVALQRHSEEIYETVVTSLEENKNSLDVLLEELKKSAKINPSLKKYIKLLKINAHLSLENTQLKLFLITKNSGVKEYAEVRGNAVSLFTQSENKIDAYQISQRQNMFSVSNIYRRSEISSSKVGEDFCKLKKINLFHKFDKKTRHKSMSDSLLARNFYK